MFWYIDVLGVILIVAAIPLYVKLQEILGYYFGNGARPRRRTK